VLGPPRRSAAKRAATSQWWSKKLFQTIVHTTTSLFTTPCAKATCDTKNHSGGGRFLLLESALAPCLYWCSIEPTKRLNPRPGTPGRGSVGEGRMRHHKPTQFLFPSTLNKKPRSRFTPKGPTARFETSQKVNRPNRAERKLRAPAY
jgi:hypothetical protein